VDYVPEAIQLQIVPDPVFIIGSPRSGTSVMAWSLAQHTACWTSAESDILIHLFGRGRFDTAYQASVQRGDGNWLSLNDVSRVELLGTLGLGFNALFTSRSGGKRWIDQSPSYTLMVGILADMFPTARFVHILRDGRLVVRSMLKSGFAEDWADSFGEACKAWSHFVEEAMTFCNERPARGKTVLLDEIAADPEARFAELQDWLELEQEPWSARFFQENRINSSYAAGDSRRADDGNAVWQTWSAEERRTFADVAGETLFKYGLAAESDLKAVPIAPR
jgi:hypothetical protein